MRIIGGEFRSRIISMPKGVDIRPTQDKVREAIFNLLGDISGKEMLELFAGSGAFGIEALSRGAGHVTFVDNNFRCAATIRANIESLGIDMARYDIIRANALRALPALAKKNGRFDIIFLDPPYYQDLAKKCLINMDACDILSPIGLVLVEHFKKDIIQSDLKTLILREERRYGDVVISIYRRVYDKDEDSSLPGNI